MIRYMLKISWIACALLMVFYNFGWGSGGSLISAGAIGRARGSETGYRQLVKLDATGQILSAKPENTPIQLITLNAPDLNEGHLIIRELNITETEKSIFISAPQTLYSLVKRATIYLNPASSGVSLYQELGNGWEPVEPIQLITAGEPGKGSANQLWAYPVTQLGHFRLLRATSDSMPIANNEPFPIGSIRIGVFPWIFAGLLFATISILSYFIHIIERRGAN